MLGFLSQLHLLTGTVVGLNLNQTCNVFWVLLTLFWIEHSFDSISLIENTYFMKTTFITVFWHSKSITVMFWWSVTIDVGVIKLMNSVNNEIYCYLIEAYLWTRTKQWKLAKERPSYCRNMILLIFIYCFQIWNELVSKHYLW